MSTEENQEPEVEKISPEEVVIDEPLPYINGVTPEAADAIKKMLERGVRYFGSAGASLTWQAYGDNKGEAFNPELAKVGLEGERGSSKFLQNWIKDKPNCVLIDSAHINMEYKKLANIDEDDEPNEELDEETGIVDGKDTDHILIMGSEVLLIDTKKWKKKSRYQVSQNGRVLRNGKEFSGSKIRMKNAVYIWHKFFSGRFRILGVVLVNSEEVKVQRDHNWFRQQAFRVVEMGRMEEFLDKKWAKLEPEDRRHINTTLVAQAALSAIKPYDMYEEKFNKATINSLLGK